MASRRASVNDVQELRKSSGFNQTAFWTKYGVTQSGGSRYENGRNVPKPVRMLLQAQIDGVLDDATLAKLMKKVTHSKKGG